MNKAVLEALRMTSELNLLEASELNCEENLKNNSENTHITISDSEHSRSPSSVPPTLPLTQPTPSSHLKSPDLPSRRSHSVDSIHLSQADRFVLSLVPRPMSEVELRKSKRLAKKRAIEAQARKEEEKSGDGSGSGSDSDNEVCIIYVCAMCCMYDMCVCVL